MLTVPVKFFCTEELGGFLMKGPNDPIVSRIVEKVGGGAMVPITSFGHQLIHGGLHAAESHGVFGLVMGMFDLTASGISAAIVFSFFLTLIFKPKN